MGNTWDILKPTFDAAYWSYIDLASKTVKNRTPYYKHFQPAVLTYLKEPSVDFFRIPFIKPKTFLLSTRFLPPQTKDNDEAS